MTEESPSAVLWGKSRQPFRASAPQNSVCGKIMGKTLAEHFSRRGQIRVKEIIKQEKQMASKWHKLP